MEFGLRAANAPPGRDYTFHDQSGAASIGAAFSHSTRNGAIANEYQDDTGKV